jgi:diguanylate cyclase
LRTLDSWRPESINGRMRVVAWTLSGTAAAVCVAVTYNWLVFREFGEQVLRESIISAMVLPIVFGSPVFFYLNHKLRELALANHRLRDLASRDSLTGSLSRTAFSLIVETRLEAACARGTPGGALLVVDVDHFKTINDKYGHDTGDEALRLISEAMASVLRRGDVIGRLGGEEFGIHLPGADMDVMARVAERVRLAVARVDFCPDGTHHPISVSIGCAVHDGQSDFPRVFRVADQNLLQAKRDGRNRVILDSPPPLVPLVPELSEIR